MATICKSCVHMKYVRNNLYGVDIILRKSSVRKNGFRKVRIDDKFLRESSTNLEDNITSRNRKIVTVSVMHPPSKDLNVSSSNAGILLDSGEIGSDSQKSSTWKVLPEIWDSLSEKCGQEVALYDPHKPNKPEISFEELHRSILQFGEGLRVLGMKQGDCVSLFSENSHRWIIADQGTMSIGAHNAVRGSRAATPELLTIVNHSESVALVLESDDLLERLSPSLLKDNELNSRLKFCIVLWTKDEKEKSQVESNLPFPVYSYTELMETGLTSIKAIKAVDKWGKWKKPEIRPNDLATIVYTSGTSGNPKGVMLSHANLMHQVHHLETVICPQRGETVLSLLPPWHMYERSAEYFVLSRGAKQVYSSVKTFKEDLSKFPPDFFVAVPLVFETLYNAIQKKLAAASALRATIAQTLISASLAFLQAKRVVHGTDLEGSRKAVNVLVAACQWLAAAAVVAALLPLHLLAKKLVYKKIKEALGIRKLAVSGGGSLPSHVDHFFAAIGLTLLNGYGLTETSPVLTARTQHRNVLGTVGSPITGTEIQVTDPETGEVLPAGKKGIVKARGPQVMNGYFKDPAATARVMDKDGFFDTGDLGWLTPEVRFGSGRNCGGLLVLDGRAKDTIVLANGENVEPAAIEEIVLQSKLVSQVMVVGQDQRKLGAIIVPNSDAVEFMLDAGKKSAEEVKSAIKEDLAKCFNQAGMPGYLQLVGRWITAC